MKIFSVLALLLSAQFAQAQVTQGGSPFPELKGRMTNCGYSNGVANMLLCVGGVLLDAMEYTAMRGTTLPNPTPVSQKLVVVYGTSDNCSTSALATLVMSGNYGMDLQQCNTMANKNERSWSMSINGKCININDTNAFGACSQAITATDK